MFERLNPRESAEDAKVKLLLDEHPAEPRGHVETVKDVLRPFGWKVDDSACPAIDGLQKEARATVKNADDSIVDSVILQGALEVEHHESGVYENLILNAEAMSCEDVAPVARGEAARALLEGTWAGLRGRSEEPLLVDTQTMDRASPSDGEQRGIDRAQAAEERGEHARERAQEAHEDAESAATPESAEMHEREADLHEEAAELHEDAKHLQEDHAREMRGEEPLGDADRAEHGDAERADDDAERADDDAERG